MELAIIYVRVHTHTYNIRMCVCVCDMQHVYVRMRLHACVYACTRVTIATVTDQPSLLLL